MVLSLGCQPAIDPGEPPQESVIFLLRHAEKVDESDGSPLTEQGQRRAETLANLLRDSEVQSIYSSDFVRTRTTAAPLAQQLGLEVEIYNQNDLAPFAKQLLANPGRHLVVGHSNTTPELVGLLGGDSGPDIQRMEYDRLYMLVHRRDVGTTTVVLRFNP
jgi:phosphohistidine phosphatase SixA